MPPPFRQIGPTQVELRDGGGCTTLFGLIFLIPGLFSMLLGLGIVPMQRASEASRLGLFLMGLVVAAVGAALTFGRRRTIFDSGIAAGQGRVIRSWELIVPIRRLERNLDEFTAVLVVVDSNSDSADTYPVRLTAKSGKDFAICSSAQFGESRERAGFLARFLHLDLMDKSTDHELVLSPDQAGETLKQRLHSGRLQPEQIVRPMAMRSEVDESGGQVRLVIPGPPWADLRFAIGAAISITLAVALIRMLVRLLRQTSPDPGQVIVLSCLVFFLGVLPLLGLLVHSVFTARSRTVVTASANGILIEKHRGWRTTTTQVPAGDILALDYGTMDTVIASAVRSAGRDPGNAESPLVAMLKKAVPSKGIVVKSRRGLFTFGEGLSGEELRYLQSVITRVLANV